MTQTIREYVWSRTERLLPNARDSVRDAARDGILQYVKWLDTPPSKKGQAPDLGFGYVQRAGEIYRDFLHEIRRLESADYNRGVHLSIGGDPKFGSSGHSMFMRVTKTSARIRRYKP
ncbi:MAG: hypothetical protein WC613_00100 [Candidatus Aenigmatarchaeota archaeon]